MIIVWFFGAFSILVLLISALGVIRLPNALARQHAATKAATLSIGLMLTSQLVYATLINFNPDWIIRLLMLMGILLLTLPLASHALGRAGVKEQQHRDSASSI